MVEEYDPIFVSTFGEEIERIKKTFPNEWNTARDELKHIDPNTYTGSHDEQDVMFTLMEKTKAGVWLGLADFSDPNVQESARQTETRYDLCDALTRALREELDKKIRDGMKTW